VKVEYGFSFGGKRRSLEVGYLSLIFPTFDLGRS
jgi:hypothetical protein